MAAVVRKRPGPGFFAGPARPPAMRFGAAAAAVAAGAVSAGSTTGLTAVAKWLAELPHATRPYVADGGWEALLWRA